MGFSFKFRGKERLIYERSDIIALRERYLRAIKKFRENNPDKDIVCNDETWLNPKQAGGGGGGGIRPQAGSSLCCAETLSSRKLKLSDFYYILIGLNSEYKPVP